MALVVALRPPGASNLKSPADSSNCCCRVGRASYNGGRFANGLDSMPFAGRPQASPEPAL